MWTADRLVEKLISTYKGSSIDGSTDAHLQDDSARQQYASLQEEDAFYIEYICSNLKGEGRRLFHVFCDSEYGSRYDIICLRAAFKELIPVYKAWEFVEAIDPCYPDRHRATMKKINKSNENIDYGQGKGWWTSFCNDNKYNLGSTRILQSSSVKRSRRRGAEKTYVWKEMTSNTRRSLFEELQRARVYITKEDEFVDGVDYEILWNKFLTFPDNGKILCCYSGMDIVSFLMGYPTNYESLVSNEIKDVSTK